jgi:tetratricopeptide (TPR) repeat protein
MKQKRRPTLALCVIARDEEANIAACLDSARPFVDEVVVVDTGSLDRTREVAREHGARVSEFTWCDDFSAARNTAIEAATADWILMLDADERLLPESGPRLRPLLAAAPAGLHCYLPLIDSVINPDSADGYLSSHHSRLFRRSDTLRFVGAIHEALRFLPQPAATTRLNVPEIRIHHTGYIPEYYRARGKDDRNSQILQRWRTADPSDPLVHFHIGVQHSAMNRHSDTAEAMRRCIELAGSERPWFLVDAYMRLINALIQTGQEAELDHLVAEADRANLIATKARELLAAYSRKRGRVDEAERHLLSALDPGCASALTVYPGAGGWSARVALMDLYAATGRAALAMQQAELALQDAGLLNRARVAGDAARIAAHLGRAQAVMRWLSEAAAHTSDEYESQSELLQLRLKLLTPEDLSSVEQALVQRDWQLAYDRAIGIPLDSAFASAVVMYIAECLQAEGAAEAALDLLQRTIDSRPHWTRVYWLLVQVLAKLGKYQDAMAAVEVLRQLEASERPAA